MIVCEGEKTEPLYFQALRQEYRLSSLDVRIVQDKSAPMYVVQEAIRRQNELDDEQDEVRVSLTQSAGRPMRLFSKPWLLPAPTA